MNFSLKEKFQAVPKYIWILLAIIFVGVFLRTYQFRDWLYFYPDQARDLVLARDVISGQSSWPVLGAIAASSPFKLGPMYYYFQIIVGEIFGVHPETMAYPDLFFGVLSIPLLFYLLRKYFTPNLSLLLTSIYSVSYFAIKYSRFAWNTNPIPFFVILFFLALLGCMDTEEKRKWLWAVALGVSIGVGVQLHTVLLLLMPATVGCVFVYLLWKRQLKWSIVAIVIAFILLLNLGQLSSERETNFHNARYFWTEMTTRSPQGGHGFFKNMALDILCHAQANTHLLTSLDNKDYCNTVEDLVNTPGHPADRVPYSITLGSLVFGLCFLAFSFFSWLFFMKRETDSKRKQFLGLLALYTGLSFFVIFPVMDDNAPMRYFLPTIFVPFICLGLLFRYISLRFIEKGRYIILGITILFVLTNITSLGNEALAYAQNNQSRSNYVVLGELEQMRDFILIYSGKRNEIYFMGAQKFYQNYTKPFSFVFEEKGVMITKVKSIDALTPGKPLFYIADEGEDSLARYIPEHPVLHEKRIGHVILLILKNQ
ncbi:MAG: glycosyltransferase family 39 protein [Candidatus Moraniibacteriota bacterium]